MEVVAVYLRDPAKAGPAAAVDVLDGAIMLQGVPIWRDEKTRLLFVGKPRRKMPGLDGAEDKWVEYGGVFERGHADILAAVERRMKRPDARYADAPTEDDTELPF